MNKNKNTEIREAVFNKIDFGRIQVTVIFEDGKKEIIFSYYPYRLTFHQDELIGLTKTKARALFLQKEKEYINGQKS